MKIQVKLDTLFFKRHLVKYSTFGRRAKTQLFYLHDD